MALRTDYKDDILDISKNEKRKYNMITNSDGTVSFEDVTVYSQVGDTFGAADVNKITDALNNTEGSVRYNSETDMIQIKDAEGVWHDWARGGLKQLDVTSIGTAYWNTVNTSAFSVDGGIINLQTPNTGSGSIRKAYAQTKETYSLSNYKTLKLLGSLKLSGYYSVSGISVQVIVVNNGVENLIYEKPITTQSTTIDETVTLSNLPVGDSNIRIVLNWHNNYSGNLTLSECKFV